MMCFQFHSSVDVWAWTSWYWPTGLRVLVESIGRISRVLSDIWWKKLDVQKSLFMAVSRSSSSKIRQLTRRNHTQFLLRKKSDGGFTLLRSNKLFVTAFHEISRHNNATMMAFFFLNSHSGGWSPSWVHSARRPLNSLLYLPRVIMTMENLVEWRLAGETEVLGENLPQRHFVHHKSHLTRPGFEPGPKHSEKTCPSANLSITNPTWSDPGMNLGRSGGKPATNRLSYGAAMMTLVAIIMLDNHISFTV
jgi:hypothetical protein